MRYTQLAPRERRQLMQSLRDMPAYLERQFGTLTPEAARRGGAGGTFSPLEQVWHLADLEHEGFAVRIRRLLEEQAPQLADFDGARLARERDYCARSLRAGLDRFAGARAANLELLENLTERQWQRGGSQEGFGPLMLCDLPLMLEQHDAAHRAEIEAWRAGAA